MENEKDFLDLLIDRIREKYGKDSKEIKTEKFKMKLVKESEIPKCIVCGKQANFNDGTSHFCNECWPEKKEENFNRMFKALLSLPPKEKQKVVKFLTEYLDKYGKQKSNREVPF